MLTRQQVDNLKAGDHLYIAVEDHIHPFKIARITEKLIFPERGCSATKYRRLINKGVAMGEYSTNRTEAAEDGIKAAESKTQHLKGQVDKYEKIALLLYEKLKEGDL